MPGRDSRERQRSPSRSRADTLPMPAKRSRPVHRSSWATATAAPLVPARAVCSFRRDSAGGRRAQWRSSSTAAVDARAASLPCPSPSASISVNRSPDLTQAQASPEKSAPANGTLTPPACTPGPPGASAPRPCRQTRATATVPRPGTLCRPKASARRRHVPRPAPSEPLEETPSRSAASTSAIPGPWSMALICTARPGIPSGGTDGATTSMSTRPACACLSRFVASSVATSATEAVRRSSSPARAAASSAATRTSRTRVGSCTGTSHTRGIRRPRAAATAGRPTR